MALSRPSEPVDPGCFLRLLLYLTCLLPQFACFLPQLFPSLLCSLSLTRAPAWSGFPGSRLEPVESDLFKRQPRMHWGGGGQQRVPQALTRSRADEFLILQCCTMWKSCPWTSRHPRALVARGSAQAEGPMSFSERTGCVSALGVPGTHGGGHQYSATAFLMGPQEQSPR